MLMSSLCLGIRDPAINLSHIFQNFSKIAGEKIFAAGNQFCFHTSIQVEGFRSEEMKKMIFLLLLLLLLLLR
jgi:hypothetical protein